MNQRRTDEKTGSVCRWEQICLLPDLKLSTGSVQLSMYLQQKAAVSLHVGGLHTWEFFVFALLAGVYSDSSLSNYF